MIIQGPIAISNPKISRFITCIFASVRVFYRINLETIERIPNYRDGRWACETSCID